MIASSARNCYMNIARHPAHSIMDMTASASRQ